MAGRAAQYDPFTGQYTDPNFDPALYGATPPSWTPNPTAPSTGNSGVNGLTAPQTFDNTNTPPPANGFTNTAPDPMVTLHKPDGTSVQVPASQAQGYVAQGYRVDTGIVGPPATSTPPPATSTGVPGTSMPEGVDPTKWNDPNKHDPKYDVLHILSGYQPNAAGLQSAAAQLATIGASVVGNDSVRLADGTVIDVGRGFSGAGTTGLGGWYWNPTTGANGAPLPPSSGAGGVDPSMYGSGTGSASGDALFNLLMQRATAGENVSASDPIIRNQVDAFSAQQQRAQRDYLYDTAEQSGPIANIQSERRASAETVGQNVGTFQAQIMQQELTAQRDQIQKAIDGALGYVTEQQRQALQLKLQQMNDSLQYLQLQQQNDQFGRTMSQQDYQFNQTDKFRNSPLNNNN